MSKKHRHSSLKQLIEFTDDEFELVELLAESSSMLSLTENRLSAQKAERMLIKEKLARIRQTRTDYSVTDHALARYLERVKGVDVQAIREEMLGLIPDNYVEGASGKYVDLIEVGVNDLCYVMRDGLIVTIRPVEARVAS